MTNSKPRAYTVDEIRETLCSGYAELVPYWVNTNHYYYAHRPLVEKISGLMHSFYSFAAGSSFLPSLDMNVYSTAEAKARSIARGENWFPVGVENAVDINDGSLQYHSAAEYPIYEKYMGHLKDETEVPREMTAQEMRFALLTKVAEILNRQVFSNQPNVSNLDRAANVMRELFDMFENGADGWDARIQLVTAYLEEDETYFKANGENWYDATILNNQSESLTAVWDRCWEQEKK